MTTEEIRFRQQILEKFQHIGSLNEKELIENLRQVETIEGKLNYLKEVKALYYDRYEFTIKTLEDNEKFHIAQNEDFILVKIFGKSNLISTLRIPETVYNEFFKGTKDNPEFTYWFLKYNAEVSFNYHIKSKKFIRKMASALKRELLQADLDELNTIESRAKELLAKKDVDFTLNYREGAKGHLWAFHKNIDLIEVLRILDENYYKENPTYSINGSGNEVDAFFKFYFLKPYLEIELSKLEASNSNKKQLTVSDTVSNSTKELLQSIWLPEPRISVESFLQLGKDKKIWNEKYEIITKRGSLFGTGKSLLANCAFSLRGYSISENTDYKEVGRVFCEAFNVTVSDKIREPYKLFCSTDSRKVQIFKREFGIRL